MNYIQQVYKGKNKWYLYLLSVFVILFGWQILGVIPLLIVAVIYSSDINEFKTALATNFSSLEIDKNLYLFLILFTFFVGLLALLFSIKKIHKRSILSLVTSRKKIDWGRYVFAFSLLLIVLTLLIGIELITKPENFIFNFKPIPFFTLLLVSLVMLPIQTACEELIFRGYFMQALGALVKNRWFPLVVTSVLFGLLHGLNPEVEKMGSIVMIFYIGTGLFFGITTLMDEGTEIALGLHAANNVASALFITTDWSALQTDAMYIDTSEPDISWLMFMPVFVLYPILLIILSKKYKWTGWREKLLGAVEKPKELNKKSVNV